MKFHVLFCFVLLSFSIQSQESIENQLLERLEEIGATGNDVSNYFTKEELVVLKNHFKSDNTLNPTLKSGNLEGVNFYGYETTSDMFGFVEIDDPGELSFLSTGGMSTATESGGAINPDNQNQAYVVDSDGNFFEVEISSGEYTFLGTLLVQGISALEFNTVDNTLYALTGNKTGAELYIIDPVKLSTTFVGLLNSVPAGIPVGLAIDGQGNAFMYDILDDNLYSINLSSGNSTVIGSLGFDANFGQGMAWDPNTDEIYLMAFNADAFDAEVRIFDRANFTTTLIGGILPGETTQLSWGTIPLQIPNAVEENIFVASTDIFPNPTSGILNISNSNNRQIQQVDILDTNGRLVRTYARDGATAAQIQVELPEVKGVYFVRIYFENASILKRALRL